METVISQHRRFAQDRLAQPWLERMLKLQVEPQHAQICQQLRGQLAQLQQSFELSSSQVLKISINPQQILSEKLFQRLLGLRHRLFVGLSDFPENCHFYQDASMLEFASQQLQLDLPWFQSAIAIYQQNCQPILLEAQTETQIKPSALVNWLESLIYVDIGNLMMVLAEAEKVNLIIDYISDQARVSERDNVTPLSPALRQPAGKSEKIAAVKHHLCRQLQLDFQFCMLYLGVQNGHDRIYAEFEMLMRGQFSDIELLTSLGNGEFLIGLRHVSGDETIYRLHQQLQQLSAKLQPTTPNAPACKIAIGIALYPDDGELIDDILKCAEAAYRKAAGSERGLYFYGQQRNNCYAANISKARALADAIEKNQIELHFQPKLDLKQQTLAGFEALARWQIKPGVWVPPAEFILIAEQFDLIADLGKVIFRLACEHQNNCLQGGLKLPPIAVNVSARQFEDHSFIQFMLETLIEYGLTGKELMLELTESCILEQSGELLDKLLELKALGFNLALDDFGTGYSALAYLRQFPFDFVKIDRSFVCELPGNQDDAAITKAILAMAHNLGLTVIAEGVEQTSQLEFLAYHGCDQIQGYWYAKALKPEQINVWLMEQEAIPVKLEKVEASKSLLLVDDEKNILSALKRLFRRDGYQIFSCDSAAEGLQILAQHSIDVIISDQRMPEITGVEFLREAKKSYPDTVRIILSGYADFQYITEAINEGAIYKFLSKPWDDDQLRQSIADAFQYKSMQDENRRLSKELQSRNYELAKANRQLKDALQLQTHQLEVDKVNLEVVDDILQQLAFPILGVDDQLQIVFANQIALNDLSQGAVIFEQNLLSLFPELQTQLDVLKQGQFVELRGHHRNYQVSAKLMGKYSRSNGMIIIFSPWPGDRFT